MTGFEKLFSLIRKNEKRTGSDYTATVTRVKDGTAYVQITGAEITDTPVSMSVDAKAGDQVRLRINNGKAWLTGNDTRPPNDSTADIEDITKTSQEHGRKLKELEDLTGKCMPAAGIPASNMFNFSGVQIFARNVERHGKRIFFNIEVYVNPLTTGSRFVIGAVDASIRPAATVYFPGVVTNNSYAPVGNAILSIDKGTGQLRAASSTTSGGFLFFAGSYETI